MLTYDRKFSQTRSDTAAKIDKRYPQRRTLATAKIDPTQVALWSNWGAASGQHIQTKLTVSQPDDALEREADHVADQVMRTSDPASSDSVALPAYSDHPLSMSRDDLLLRAEDQTEEQPEDPIHRACDRCTSAAADDDDGTVLRKVDRSAGNTAVARPGSWHARLAFPNHRIEPVVAQSLPAQVKSGAAASFRHRLAAAQQQGGMPLPKAAREFMEPRFGREFSNVRVHADSRASSLARSIGARAFAVGRDLFFKTGEYRPDTSTGQRLLAHELAHVVQQSPGVVGKAEPSATLDEAPIQRKADIADCTSTEKAEVATALGLAAIRLTGAIAALGASPLSANTLDALWLTFRDDSQTTADQVRKGLVQIQAGLPNATVECEQPDSFMYGHFCTSNAAYVRSVAALLGVGNIHVCMGHWSNQTLDQRSLLLIHEASHRFSNTGDQGYFDNCLDSTQTVFLPPNVRLDNADSYACFVGLLGTANLSSERANLSGATQWVIDQSPAGPIDLNATAANSPVFSFQHPLQQSARVPGFKFRWVLRDPQQRSYLMLGKNGDASVFQFGWHLEAYIGLPTRALLKSRGIRAGEVLLRVKIPRAGEQLLSLPVTFKF